ncbi:MAG: polysaccharide deacetylase family protein [Phycisphaerales bacterium]|nr:MAG: polysaccharide deacetylase family protein [Phycisphaerales bacterium]
MTGSEFTRQLDLLRETLTPIDWPSLYAWAQGRADIPERCFLLTFDDGLADHARNVVPILEDRDLRGVFFVPGRILTSHRMLPAHAVHLLLAAIGEERLLDELDDYLKSHGDEARGVDSLDPAAVNSMYHYETPVRANLKYLLTMALPNDLRNAAVDTLFERHVGASARWSRHWYLGWDDLVRMQSRGHTIGGHGFSHEPYIQLTPSQRDCDVHREAAVLRDGLGVDIRPFSYPFGRHDDAISAACRAAGFAHAFTTEQSWVTRDSDTMRLPRVDTINVAQVLAEEVTCSRS